jgi:hypothetical protein
MFYDLHSLSKNEKIQLSELIQEYKEHDRLDILIELIKKEKIIC